MTVALRCALVVVALATSACTPQRPGDAASPTAPPEEPRGSITVVDGRDTSRGRLIERFVNDWNEGPRGRGNRERVNFVQLPASTDEHRAQLLARAQDMAEANGAGANQGQCYDVVMLDLIWTAEFARAGYLRPLDPDFFELHEFLGQAVKGARFDGEQWAVPARADAGLLFYRKDILDEENVAPPRTWEDLAHQARTIAPRHGLEGYVGQFAQYEGFTVNALEAIWAGGGDVLSGSDGKVVIDSPAATAGIDLLMTGFRDGWIPADALSYNEELSREAFQRDGALFMRNWPYVHALLDAPDSPVAGKVGVTTLPSASALGGWNLAVSRCSTNLGTAYDFIKEFTQEQNQRQLFQEAGFAPVRTALYEDAELRAQHPYLAALSEALKGARNRPATPYYNQLSRLLVEHLQPAVNSDESLSPVMDLLASRLTTAQGGR